MAQITIQGSDALAKQIKLRRNELGLTIEEAASRAGVGTKTWCRYEAGESIRADKCKGICKALNWYRLPDQENEEDEGLSIQDYQNHAAWSPFLADAFGAGAAVAFAVGSDILLEHIIEEMEELASMPAESHVGQLSISWLRNDLPEQFLMHYNYDFLYQLKCTLKRMIWRAKDNCSMTAHSVMEELLLYLCNEKATAMIELCGGIRGLEDGETVYSGEWVFDLFDDMDITSFLYSDVYLDTDHPYHFSHWSDQQFFMDSDE